MRTAPTARRSTYVQLGCAGNGTPTRDENPPEVAPPPALPIAPSPGARSTRRRPSSDTKTTGSALATPTNAATPHAPRSQEFIPNLLRGACSVTPRSRASPPIIRRP